jgi:hypothetical protein
MPSLDLLQELILAFGRATEEFAQMRASAQRLEDRLSPKGRRLLKKLGREYALWSKRAVRSQKELSKIQHSEPFEFIERMAALLERDTEETRKTARALVEIFREHAA